MARRVHNSIFIITSPVKYRLDGVISGLDSGMGGLEAVLTGLMDEFKSLQKFKYGREVLTLAVVYGASFMSIMCTTQGGVYVFTLLGESGNE